MCKDLGKIRIYMLYNMFLDGTIGNEKMVPSPMKN